MVQTNDHILRRNSHRAAIRRLQDVVRGQHEDTSLSLSLGRQRQVNCHLVTIEVSVERRANQRVQLNSLTLNQLRLKRLNTEAVQGRCTVQQNRVLSNNLFQNVPNLRAETLNHTLSALNVLSVAQLHQTLHDEGLEQLQSHLLGQTTLVHLQLRTNHNHGTTRVVNTLTEQVLTETTLLTLQHVRQRLQGAVTGASHRATATTVIEERVHSFLQHTLLVVHDNLGSTQLQQTLQTVVTVNHTTVQVVQVGGRETATVQLNHRAQFRRNNRNNIQNHTQRGVIGGQEGVNNLQTLQSAGLLLTLTGLNDLLESLSLSLQVEGLQTLLNSLCAHRALKVQAVLINHGTVQRLIALKVSDLQVLEAIPHALQVLSLTLVTLTHRRELTLSVIAQLTLLSSLAALSLNTSQLRLNLTANSVHVSVQSSLKLLLLTVVSSLQHRQILMTSFLVNLSDHVRSEVNDLLQVLRSQIQQVTQAGRNTLEVPNVGNRSSQLNVTHTLTTYLRAGHLNTTALTHNALEAHALVLTAVALPVLGGAEDTLVEEAVLLGLQGTVVDGLGLLNLTKGPTTDVVGGGEANSHQTKRRFVGHIGPNLFL